MTAYRVDEENQRIAARRLGDGARALFTADYLREHVHHGFAVTVHAAQGATADAVHAVLGEGASRAAAYVAMTRGRASDQLYLYEKIGAEGDHEHAENTPGCIWRGAAPALRRPYCCGRCWVAMTVPAR